MRRLKKGDMRSTSGPALSKRGHARQSGGRGFAQTGRGTPKKEGLLREAPWEGCRKRFLYLRTISELQKPKRIHQNDRKSEKKSIQVKKKKEKEGDFKK